MNILNEIQKIRGNKNGYEASQNLVKSNRSRYRVIAREKDMITVYGFSVPICYENNRELIKSEFVKEKGCFAARGSNCQIFVKGRSIALTKYGSQVMLLFDEQHNFTYGREKLSSDKVDISLTFNGIVASIPVKAGEQVCVTLSSGNKIMSKRKNSKYFAFMRNRFEPLAYLSALFLKGEDGNYYPIHIRSEEIDKCNYKITIESDSQISGDIMFEFNMHEDKLIQDTTVDELHPKENNAFGSMAFIGTTTMFGEQRLYNKLNFHRFNDLRIYKIDSVKLYIPKFGSVDPNIAVYKMDNRFCSFGSTWATKKDYGTQIDNVYTLEDYLVVDMTSVLCDANHYIKESNGILIKASYDESGGGCILATGDNYWKPQIIEIKYKQ